MSGLMQILLLKVSAHITEQLGMAPGGEFREAFKEVDTFYTVITSSGYKSSGYKSYFVRL